MKKICLFLLLIFLASCATNSTKYFNEISIDNGEKTMNIYVEIADDDQERADGLMFRETLDKNSGMLFVFDDEDYRAFWMKNTLIPLDIIFIDKNFKIIDIKYAVPCKEDPCVLYKPEMPAKYVLELNANFTIENHIRVGNKLQKTKLFK